MQNIQFRLILIKCLILFLIVISSCGGDEKIVPDEEKVGGQVEEKLDPITNFVAEETDNANELKLAWDNSSNIVTVAISYIQEGEGGEKNAININVKVFAEKKSFYTLKLPVYATYSITAVSIDNYGNRSEKRTITATPAKEDAPISYEVVDSKLPIADPYVLYYEGKYYAYGTKVNGFEVYISEDLTHWKRSENLALSPENSWGTRWYWAPEVYYVASKNMFYMFYSVDEHICVASAIRPEGPFVQTEKKPIISEKGIDTSLFIDEDGTPYLYFVRFTGGNVIWVAEMTDDLRSIKTETLTKCISAEDPWERIQGTIAEGPSVLKRGDTYYLIYSANHFESKDYAVGYATASSPNGPWKKSSVNPILRRDNPAASGLVGVGHGAPFVSVDGSYKYIYHAHGSVNSVGPRTSYINDLNISEDGVISISGEAIRPVVVR